MGKADAEAQDRVLFSDGPFVIMWDGNKVYFGIGQTWNHNREEWEKSYKYYEMGKNSK